MGNLLHGSAPGHSFRPTPPPPPPRGGNTQHNKPTHGRPPWPSPPGAWHGAGFLGGHADWLHRVHCPLADFNLAGLARVLALAAAKARRLDGVHLIRRERERDGVHTGQRQ